MVVRAGYLGRKAGKGLSIYGAAARSRNATRRLQVNGDNTLVYMFSLGRSEHNHKIAS
jgi:hypothetical protein